MTFYILICNFDICISTFNFFYNSIGHLACPDSSWVITVGFHIVGYAFAFGNHRGHSVFELVCFSRFAYVPEHQYTTEYQGRWVYSVLAFVFLCASMCFLEDGAFIADVCTGCNA